MGNIIPHPEDNTIESRITRQGVATKSFAQQSEIAMDHISHLGQVKLLSKLKSENDRATGDPNPKTREYQSVS